MIAPAPSCIRKIISVPAGVVSTHENVFHAASEEVETAVEINMPWSG
jgi:hypothetical protein